MNRLSALEFFGFRGNIVDGDVSWLLRLPKLKVAGFNDKRHYTHKTAEIRKLLAGEGSGVRPTNNK